MSNDVKDLLEHFGGNILDEYSNETDGQIAEMYCRNCGVDFVNRRKSYTNEEHGSPVTCSLPCYHEYKAKIAAGAPARLEAFLAKLTPEQRAAYSGSQPLPATIPESTNIIEE